ncbi:phage tail assembly chaperone [Chengkuizengella marina]|uniref:Phage XkdN-like tail assembly chaperone protein, TAC n=1 Tax=Chengkuizengella marina TaxID=2507566 RepID=A0A6N9Q7W1_9BACL|nr:hypothetical protein [Chengkuizengella marina]NBI30899.1 hypothetical protein [Chengkuizengella marina]
MSKKLTIADLLSQKEQLKKRKKRTMTLYIESVDAEIIIEEPSRAFAMEALEMAQDDKRSDQADTHVVYHCVVEPNLKDKELQKQFGCVEPTDIVDIIFRPGEVSTISRQVLELAGYGQGVQKVDREIKN